MDFYTNIMQSGNTMLVRGVKNGERILARHKFRPTLYVPVQKQTSQTSLDGKYLTPIIQESISSAKEFVSQYEFQPGLVYGMTRYPYQYLSDNFKYDVKWNIEDILVVTIDIEVASENGFPKVEESIEELLAITVKNHQSKKIVVFGIGEYKNSRDDVTYHNCADEEELLKRFIAFWESSKPDVLTGWNSKFYDLPYIIHRIRALFGENEVKRLSVWKTVFKDSIYIQGKENICYNVTGLEQLDYLDLYRKFTYSAQESYRLDHIAFVELGQRKEENPYDTFREWYTKDYQSFIDYNIQDVELVDRLEDKMKLIDLIFTMAYSAKCNYGDVFSQVKMWDIIMYNYLRDKNIQIPLIQRKEKTDAFAGA
jgi:DNA polymerase elongation subunit (family B)